MAGHSAQSGPQPASSQDQTAGFLPAFALSLGRASGQGYGEYGEALGWGQAGRGTKREGSTCPLARASLVPGNPGLGHFSFLCCLRFRPQRSPLPRDHRERLPPADFPSISARKPVQDPGLSSSQDPQHL